MNADRRAYTDGLRQIADFLDEHPEVPLPWLSSSVAGALEPTLFIYLVSDGQREVLAEIARAMGNVQKFVSEQTGQFYVRRKFAGMALVASADRDEVCQRVVTGTREVVKEVRDPGALAAVPLVTVTETVEDVEWVCTSLLKAEEQADG